MNANRIANPATANHADCTCGTDGVHPERFPGGLPQPPARPMEVWINPPTPHTTEKALSH